MIRQQVKKVWGIPLILGGCIVFGLLSSLLGTGFWYGLSWIAMTLPLLIIGWKIIAGWRKRR